jgi:hypothetical protein
MRSDTVVYKSVCKAFLQSYTQKKRELAVLSRSIQSDGLYCAPAKANNLCLHCSVCVRDMGVADAMYTGVGTPRYV